MSDEIRLEGLGVAPGVIETIVTLAAEGVDGVAGICAGQGLAQFAQKVNKQAPRAIEFELENDKISISVHVEIVYGKPLHAIAKEIQAAVADAISSQVGAEVDQVTVFVDSITFGD